MNRKADCYCNRPSFICEPRISRLLGNRVRQRLKGDFIITGNGRHLGQGRMIDRLIIELKTIDLSGHAGRNNALLCLAKCLTK